MKGERMSALRGRSAHKSRMGCQPVPTPLSRDRNAPVSSHGLHSFSVLWPAAAGDCCCSRLQCTVVVSVAAGSERSAAAAPSAVGVGVAVGVADAAAAFA